MKKFFKDFGAFIKRGNVMDLAVAVVIGGAFTKIVNSLVADLIMPLVNALFAFAGAEGGVDGMSLVLNGVDRYLVDGTVNPEAILWNYGNFIQAIIDFLLIALVVFCLIRALKRVEEFGKKVADDVENTVKKLDGKAYGEEGEAVADAEAAVKKE